MKVVQLGLSISFFSTFKYIAETLFLFINLSAYRPIKGLLIRSVTDDKQTAIKLFRDVTAGCLSGTIADIASNPYSRFM